MKYIFADSIDTVDPGYDFIQDRNSPSRQNHWDDQYPHELMDNPPYDGILISRGIVGDHRFAGKYTPAQAMRFRRLGARKFLRLDKGACANMPIFGDCGAFSYAKEASPPYTCDEILEFYSDAGFTHGCSVDHIIFDFDKEESGLVAGSADARSRFDITLQNAQEFISNSKNLGKGFTPLGVVQGWSPSSMGEAAARLESMGYTYLAVGGLVPLKAEDIHRVLTAIRSRIRASTELHLLGFAKAEQIGEFVKYKFSSFDSTSPLIRAFKDAKSNYYFPGENGLQYFSAIRIPQATENNRLLRMVKTGAVQQEHLSKLEDRALKAVRRYDADSADVDSTAKAVAEYGSLLSGDAAETSVERSKLYSQILKSAKATLAASPWKNCDCSVCRTAGVEVIIFRSSNRNKRRGFHNLEVFHKHVQRVLGA